MFRIFSNNNELEIIYVINSKRNKFFVSIYDFSYRHKRFCFALLAFGPFFALNTTRTLDTLRSLNTLWAL